jgi:hypothetical protein
MDERIYARDVVQALRERDDGMTEALLQAYWHGVASRSEVTWALMRLGIFGADVDWLASLYHGN